MDAKNPQGMAALIWFIPGAAQWSEKRYFAALFWFFAVLFFYFSSFLLGLLFHVLSLTDYDRDGYWSKNY